MALRPGTVSNCFGTRIGGTAISADVAIGCNSSGGTINAPGGKFLGTGPEIQVACTG